MNTKIEIERRVYSNLVKTVIQTKKLLMELSNRPEFNKEWMTISDVEVEFGLSRKIIDGFRKKGLKTNQTTRNGKILIRRSELEKYLTKMK
ncbi:hypothetical protein BWK59_04040 [Flavobacterium davisii]|uniref:Helix-turn-helix domain-containing protein n=1 Tax=Flavobacterium davisii TaxID=2906077 RepID=A0A246GK65_9FLAO|nr:hypothetical protein [Flavobacterium davisii]OWP84701.1 hypothetical protein BWK59_04040 [Flavobacterium davisii]